MYQLENLKPLSGTQYDRAKQSAISRIQKRIGEKPTLEQFRREYTSIFNVLDVPYLIIFIAALLVSALHIFDYVSVAAGTHYSHVEYVTGIRIGHWEYVAIQQVAFLLLAEFSMITFFTVWRVRTAQDDADGRQKFGYLSFWLALISALFVIVVNVFGGGAVNVSAIIPPLMTIGIGLRLEEILSELYLRRKEISEKYTSALSEWETAQKDPKQHPDYLPLLYQEIWDYLVKKLTSNSEFQDAPRRFKFAAVERELSRENWSQELAHKSKTENPTEPVTAVSLNGNGSH
jgi:hypothetical protein